MNHTCPPGFIHLRGELPQHEWDASLAMAVVSIIVGVVLLLHSWWLSRIEKDWRLVAAARSGRVAGACCAHVPIVRFYADISCLALIAFAILTLWDSSKYPGYSPCFFLPQAGRVAIADFCSGLDYNTCAWHFPESTDANLLGPGSA